MAISLLGNMKPITNPNLASGIRLAPISQGGNVASTAIGTAPVKAPVATPPMGVTAKSPAANVSNAPTTLPKAQAQPLTSAPISSVDTNYQLKPGETTDQYNARVGSYNASKGSTSAPAGPAAPQAPSLSYNGLIGQAAGQASAINNTATQLGQQGQVTPQEQAAKNKLAGLPGVLGAVDANIENHPSDMAFQMGREAVAGRNVEAQRQSLAAQAESYATTRQANTQAYTGQANAQNQAGGLYQSAANSTQPQLGSYGQTYYQPLQGGSSGGGNLDPQTQASSLAQQVMSGQITYDQAVSSLGYAGNVGTTFLNNAITGAGGNPLQLQAQGSAQQSNLSKAGTIGTDTAASGYSGAAQDYVAYTGASHSADLQAQQVQSILSSTGINQGVPDYNKALNSLSGRLGSTNVTALTTALTELQNMYSKILSVGGTTPSGSEAQALSVLNPSSSAAQINASIQQLQQAAYNRGSGIYSQLQQYQSQLNGPDNSGLSSSTGGVIRTAYGDITPDL